jgi:hypothetical protein
MALDLGSSRMPDDPGRHQFWSDYTAARARNTAQPVKVIDRRVRWMFRDLCQMIEPSSAVELGAHDGTRGPPGGRGARLTRAGRRQSPVAA